MADLDAEMRRLAEFLGSPVDAAVWSSLVSAARFEAMKERAGDLAPGAHQGEWKSDADFFRAARLGAWRNQLSAQSLERYERVMAERFEPAFQRWIEVGCSGADPKA